MAMVTNGSVLTGSGKVVSVAAECGSGVMVFSHRLRWMNSTWLVAATVATSFAGILFGIVERIGRERGLGFGLRRLICRVLRPGEGAGQRDDRAPVCRVHNGIERTRQLDAFAAARI